jgi:hypothetical protein
LLTKDEARIENAICRRAGNFLRCKPSNNMPEDGPFFHTCRQGNKRMSRWCKGFELERPQLKQA